jgi:hypothetical protein
MPLNLLAIDVGKYSGKIARRTRRAGFAPPGHHAHCHAQHGGGRIFLLSGSPAQVLRDVPIERPRIGRRAEEIAAIRSMIELRVDQG